MTKSPKSESMSDTARQAADDLKETGKEALEGAKSVMGGAMSDLRAGAAAKADEVREVIAEEGSRMAQSLHEAANQKQGGVQARVLETMASGLGSVSDTIRNRDAATLMDDVESFARRNPALFIAGAAAAGILLVRLAARTGREERHDDIGTYGRGSRQAGDMGAGLQSGGMDDDMSRPGGMMSDARTSRPGTGGMMGEGGSQGSSQGRSLRDDDIAGGRGPSMGGNL